MIPRYQTARDDERFEYGVVTYLDGSDDAVAAEGYVAGDVLERNEESVVTVVEPDATRQIPFDRVVGIRYPTER